MGMTDVEGPENQGHRTPDRKPVIAHPGLERQRSVQKGLGTPKQKQRDHHGSTSNEEGDVEFEEFVLDSDDYDLLESIHTQLGSSPETTRKLCIQKCACTLLSSQRRAFSRGRYLTAVKATSRVR